MRLYWPLGCKVQMVERHPVVAALLDDGLQRAQQDPDIGGWVSEPYEVDSRFKP